MPRVFHDKLYTRLKCPVQTENVVTKHADIEVSGQTVKTCLIKHRSKNWYKPLSKPDTHARIKYDDCLRGCPNKQNITRIKLFDRIVNGLQILSKHD